MPTYEYQCCKCGRVQEVFCRISQRPTEFPCFDCGAAYYQVILTPPLLELDSIHETSWLPEAARTVSMEHKLGLNPIETRGQFKAYLKDKGLRPADSGINLSEV